MISIRDSEGAIAVSYTYDAWGNILSVSGTSPLTALNPLRYRGYVYDVETGLYYLQSRYYNPTWGRFISADAYISTGQSVLGSNMFAYCLNNPVCYIDPNGEAALFFAFVITTIVAGISNAISTATSGGSLEECIVSGLIGAGSSAVGFSVSFVTGFSPAGNIAARTVSSTLCVLGTTWYRNGRITGQDISATAVDVTMDVCFSTVTYHYASVIKDPIRQTVLNSSIDGGVDIIESELFSQPNSTEKSIVSVKKDSCSIFPSLGGETNERFEKYRKCLALIR